MDGPLSDTTLTQYLHYRDLKPALDLDADLKAKILEDDEMLAKMAGLVGSYGDVLDALIQVRIQTLVRELVEKAYPAETIIYRQAIVEVGAIVDDAEAFAAEYEKRKAAKGGEEQE